MSPSLRCCTSLIIKQLWSSLSRIPSQHLVPYHSIFNPINDVRRIKSAMLCNVLRILTVTFNAQFFQFKNHSPWVQTETVLENLYRCSRYYTRMWLSGFQLWRIFRNFDEGEGHWGEYTCCEILQCVIGWEHLEKHAACLPSLRRQSFTECKLWGVSERWRTSLIEIVETNRRL